MIRNLKILASDTALYGLSSCLAQVVGLFLVPFYSRELSPQQYGVVGLFAMVVASLNPFIAFGIDSALFRYFATTRSRFAKDSFLKTAFVAKLIISVLVSLIIIPCYNLLNEHIFSGESSALMFRLFLGSLFLENIISLGLVCLRVERRAKRILVINLSCLCVSLFFSVWLVLFEKLGVEGIMISAFITALFRGALIFNILRLRLLGGAFRVKRLKLLLHYGVPLVPHKVLSQLQNLFVLFLINHRLGLTAAGLFFVAKKFSKPLTFLVSMIQTAWAPYKFEIHKDEVNPQMVFSRIITFYWCLLIVLWMFFALLFPLLFRFLIDGRYAGAIELLPLIMLIPIFEAFKFTVVTGFELSKDQKQMSIGTIYSSFIVVVFLFFLSDIKPPYSFIAAQIVGSLFFGVFIYRKARKIIKIYYPFRSAVLALIASSLAVLSFYRLEDLYFVTFFILVVFLIIFAEYLKFRRIPECT